jgi:ribose transport system permease protein
MSVEEPSLESAANTPVPTEERGKSSFGKFVGRVDFGALRDYGIVISFVALFVVLSLASPHFLTQTNLLNILNQNAPVGLIACGGTLVLIGGGFDLSVGAIFALSGVIATEMATRIDTTPAMVLGILVGLACGVCNGAVTTIGRINPFIATLSTQIMIRGIALAITGGFLVIVEDPAFTSLGNGGIGSVKYSILLWVGFAFMCGFILQRTTFGRHVYAAGGNAEAARLSGVRVSGVRATTFAISGLSAGLAGVIVASRASTGQADAGIGLELSAIAAIVIGGTSIFGGAGAIWRTLLGVLLLALIGNGFNLLNVEAVYQQMFQGAIILTAVGIDAWARPARQ